MFSMAETARLLAGRAPTDSKDPGFQMWREIVWDFANELRDPYRFARDCDAHGQLPDEDFIGEMKPC